MYNLAHRLTRSTLDLADKDEARAFWQQSLAGFGEPIQITAPSQDSAAERQRHAVLTLSEETTSVLSSFARQTSVTLGSVIQAAWSLLLNRLYLILPEDSDDV